VSDERKYFIKRVIGLPGETLKIADGKVYIKQI
jgi:signal peptidase I